MTVYGIQFWIECKGGSKTADELRDSEHNILFIDFVSSQDADNFVAELVEF